MQVSSSPGVMRSYPTNEEGVRVKKYGQWNGNGSGNEENQAGLMPPPFIRRLSVNDRTKVVSVIRNSLAEVTRLSGVL